MVDPIDYSKLVIVPALPNGRMAPKGGEEIFQEIIGAKVTSIGGASNDVPIEGGGLIIDYERDDGSRWRLVLAFTELGMYVEDHSEVRASSERLT